MPDSRTTLLSAVSSQQSAVSSQQSAVSRCTLLQKIISKLKRLFVAFFCCKKKYLRRKMFIYKPSHLSISPKANIKISGNFNFNYHSLKLSAFRNFRHGVLKLEDNATLIVKSFTCDRGSKVEVLSGAVLKLGTGFTDIGGLIQCSKSIEIGEGCFIAAGVIIRDSHGHTIMREGFQKYEPIKIGNHVWIGTRAMILPGVTIGDNSVIAAGAVVVKDIPANCLAGGVPAQVIRENISWK